ncbi:MAG: DedA family protein [Lautropia sp.]|nr:DedA family protein [Lautropia sp.]
MDFSALIDIFLHLDKHLETVVQNYGIWVYLLMFTVIFIETGLVVMPFLPGDSLLFVGGSIAAIGRLDLVGLMGILALAAVLGDAVNYVIGRLVGPKVFGWSSSRFFNRDAFDRTHAFYERHGGITIIVARFMPFIRTFAPFVAGVAQMTYARFAMFNIVGGLLWVMALTGLGYFFGNHAWVKAHFSWVTLAMIIIPGLPALFEMVRHLMRRGRRDNSS